MNESEELAYEMGRKMAFIKLLNECLNELGSYGNEQRWRVERAEAVAALRQLCAHVGATGHWPDYLNLADVIDKHVLPACGKLR